MHTNETPKLIQPKDHKAKVLVWADIGVTDMDVLNEALTPDQIKKELAHIFNLEDYEDNSKAGILLDLYFYTLQFAKDNNFNNEQTSAFFSIVKTTHEIAVETPFGNVDHCFRYFKEAVLRHAVRRPPYSIDLFSECDVRKITEYVLNTYFRHFKMYKYAFTPLVRLDLTMAYNGIPPSPPPSEHGDADATTTEEGMDEEGEKEEGKDQEEGAVLSGDENKTEEEPSAAAELRKLIKEHLEEEIKALKLSVDEQIKESEDNISKKLEVAEGQSPAKGKGKKK